MAANQSSAHNGSEQPHDQHAQRSAAGANTPETSPAEDDAQAGTAPQAEGARSADEPVRDYATAPPREDSPAGAVGGDRRPAQAVRAGRGASRADDGPADRGAARPGHPGRGISGEDAAPRDSDTPGQGAGDAGDNPDADHQPGGLPAVAEPTRFEPAGQDDLGYGPPETRIANNLAALRTLAEVRDRGGIATAVQQQVIAHWSGWGSAPHLFAEERFAEQRAELTTLLGADGYANAEQSTQYAHYTDYSVVREIWSAVTGLGFTSGRVLEPGCGSGNFIAQAPPGAQIVGIEKDPASAAVTRALYPQAEVRVESFADTG